jgi:hypothetical protein
MPITAIPFIDGIVREFFLDDDGRQYVLDEGERVYGDWVLLDEPVIVKKNEGAES